MVFSKLARYLVYSLEIFIFYILQQTPGLIPDIFGAKPVLVYPVVITIAMFETEMPAMGFGIAGGLLIDFGFGGALGFHSIVLAILCFIVSIMTKTVLKVNIGTTILTAVWTVAVLVILGWLYQYVMSGYSYPVYVLVNHCVPKYFYTLLMFPLVYLINRAISGSMPVQEQ